MMKQKPAWFEREQPRSWGRGRIEVEGDRLTLGKTARVFVGVMIAWASVVMIFCISSR